MSVSAIPFLDGTGKTKYLLGDGAGTEADPVVLAVSGAPAGDATIVDGGDVCEGATDDVAATAGAAGTISAKLRLMTSQLDAIQTAVEAIQAVLEDVHDSGNHALKTVAVTP